MPGTATATREQRAGQFLGEGDKDQQRWFSQKAARAKRVHNMLGLVVLVGGASLPVLMVFDWSAEHAKGIAAVIGFVVALAKALEERGAYQETWALYRRTSELLKRERRLFVAGSGPYGPPCDGDEAFREFSVRAQTAIDQANRIWEERFQGEKKQKGKPGGGARDDV